MRLSRMSLVVVLFSVSSIIKMVIAHGDIPHGTDSVEPSFPIYVALGAALVSGIFPILFGMLVPLWLRNTEQLPFGLKENLEPFIRGIALGTLLFLFYDFGTLSSFAGLNSSDLILRIVLPTLLFGGLLAIDFWAFNNGNQSTVWFWIWIFGIAFHSTAEGIIMGANFLLPEPDVLRFFPAVSFVFHKFAEGFVAGVLIGEKDIGESYLLKRGGLASVFILLGVFGGYYDIHTYGGYITYLYTITLITIVATLFVLGGLKMNEDRKTHYRGMLLGLFLLYFFTVLHEV